MTSFVVLAVGDGDLNLAVAHDRDGHIVGKDGPEPGSRNVQVLRYRRKVSEKSCGSDRSLKSHNIILESRSLRPVHKTSDNYTPVEVHP